MLFGIFYSAIMHTDAGTTIGKAMSYTAPYIGYLVLLVLVLVALETISKKRCPKIGS